MSDRLLMIKLGALLILHAFFRGKIKVFRYDGELWT